MFESKETKNQKPKTKNQKPKTKNQKPKTKNNDKTKEPVMVERGDGRALSLVGALNVSLYLWWLSRTTTIVDELLRFFFFHAQRDGECVDAFHWVLDRDGDIGHGCMQTDRSGRQRGVYGLESNGNVQFRVVDDVSFVGRAFGKDVLPVAMCRLVRGVGAHFRQQFGRGVSGTVGHSGRLCDPCLAERILFRLHRKHRARQFKTNRQ